MAWGIHPFVKKPRHSHFMSYNSVQYEVMFDGEAAAAWMPIVTWLTQLWIHGELSQATVELGGIAVHLPFAPLFKGILKDIREVECSQFREEDSKISP